MHEVAPPYLPPPLPTSLLPPPPPPPPPPTFGSLCSTDGSLRLTQGPAPAPPLNNMTPALATDRLLCVPPCVCTAFCVYRLGCGPLNNKTCGGHSLLFVCSALCVHRLLLRRLYTHVAKLPQFPNGYHRSCAGNTADAVKSRSQTSSSDCLSRRGTIPSTCSSQPAAARPMVLPHAPSSQMKIFGTFTLNLSGTHKQIVLSSNR